ncbi:MAG: hypothetical protein ACYC1M_02320 [Armatimonadota bacterium]
MRKLIQILPFIAALVVMAAVSNAQATVGSFKLSKYKDIKTTYGADKVIHVEVTGTRVVLERNDGTLRMTAQKIQITSQAPAAGKARIDSAIATGGVEISLTDTKQNRKAKGTSGSAEYIGDATSPKIMLKGGLVISVEEADFTVTQKGTSGTIDLATVNGSVVIESVTLSGAEEQTEATYSSKGSTIKK